MYKLLLCFLICLCVVDSYKILLFFPYVLKSLTSLGEGYARHLLKAGHEVTFVTGYPKNKTVKNLREIDISENIEYFNADPNLKISNLIGNPQDDSYHYFHEATLITTMKALNHPNVKQLLEDPNEEFDVVIADLLEMELAAGLSVLYNCPMVWAYAMGAHWRVLKLIDESSNPAYTSDYLSSNLYPLSFTQRVEELWTQLLRSVQKDFIYFHEDELAYKEIFGPLLHSRGRNLPWYQDVIYNASMILSNDHNTLGHIPRTPQNFKFIAGYHIESPTRPLPLDLQTLMDNAKHGVIYFSLGSVFKSNTMPQPLIHGLLKMFGEIKETVIWKYEADLKNVPSNVHIVKWAPQTSILNHPNCLFFITHGGHSSAIESIYYGIPTIGVPVYMDQFINTKMAMNAGYGLKATLGFDLPKNLKVAIETMLGDQKYRLKVKELSKIFHDRVVPPGQELVHWVEHVVRTGGAPHLRSPALMMPWYQKMYLDLFALIVALSTIVLIAIKNIFKYYIGNRLFISKKKIN